MSSTATSNSSFDRKSLKRPDEFYALIRSFFEKLLGQSRLLLIGGVLFVIFATGAALFLSHRESRSDAARSAFYLAKKELDRELRVAAGVLVPTPPAPATDKKGKEKSKEVPPQAPGADAIAFKNFDVDSKLPESIKRLSSIEKEFNGTRAAYEARLALGDLYFRHGDSAKALNWYQKAADSAPGSFEKAMSFTALGHTFENQNKYAEAAQNYERALNLGEPSAKGDALLGMARAYEALRDLAKARSTYDQIITQMPNTEFAKSAELFKSQLE